MSNHWDESLHPRGEGSRFVPGDALRIAPSEVGASPYATSVAPARHADWRGERMDARTGWCEPFWVDHVDVANQPFDALPFGVRERIAHGIDGNDPQTVTMKPAGPPARIAEALAHHESAGGTIEHDERTHTVTWRTPTGQVGVAEGAGYARFGPGWREFYVGSRFVAENHDDGSVRVEDYGEVNGQRARFVDHDREGAFYVGPDSVDWRDGRSVSASDPEFWQVHDDELARARADIAARLGEYERGERR